MIGVLSDGVASSTISERHQAVLDESLAMQAEAWNQRLADAARKTQDYDKGLERFVRKFDPDQEMEATIAIAKGVHQDHRPAVRTTQQKRRCLLLGTIYGHTDEEALWYALMEWACLQLRKKRPRQYPGDLFYPEEQSHVFEKYWNHLPNLEEHPEFCHESVFTQGCPRHFSSPLSRLMPIPEGSQPTHDSGGRGAILNLLLYTI
jgi:hypothetical protein